ncbi:MAG: VOC family protein, partial [Bacteroidota bacterium]
HVPLLTTDQERDLKFWSHLGFEKKEDQPMNKPGEPIQRWLTASSKLNPDLQIILQDVTWGADSGTIATRKNQVGQQPGFCFTSTHIERDRKLLQEAGATLLGEPTDEAWGKQLLFKDLCGNTHVVVELAK